MTARTADAAPVLQSLPASAEDYARSQRAAIRAAVAAVLRLWRRMGAEFDLSYARIEAQLYDVVVRGQREVAREAADYIPAVLDETGQARAVEALARVSAAPLIGVAGDGRALESLLYRAVVRAKARVGAGETPLQALRGSRTWLSTSVGTVLSDTGRAAERLEVAVRPVSGYVRMLNPPSCARCVLLAGRVYRSAAPFLRHPGCDCRHIPAAEDAAGDLATDPRAYFDSLPAAEQDRVFTAAGAEAIRSGADIGQVVNARRGASGLAPAARLTAAERAALGRGRLRTRRVFGRDVYTTAEGTTRHGLAGQRLNARGRAGRVLRLMPESIRQLAADKHDYLRLLRLHGYLL